MRTKSLVELAKNAPQRKDLSLKDLDNFIKEVNSPENIKKAKEPTTELGYLYKGKFIPLGYPAEETYQLLYGKDKI